MIPADGRGRGGTRGSGWTCIAADFRLQNLRLTYDKVICFVVSELVDEEKEGKPAWWRTRCAYTAARTCNSAVSVLRFAPFALGLDMVEKARGVERSST